MNRVEFDLPNSSVREPDESYIVDGIKPRLVVIPRSIEELSLVMRWIKESRFSVIPMTFKTKLFIGNIPRSYDVALDLSQLNKTIDPDPDELVVRLGVSVGFSEVQDRLRKIGRRIPVDPPLSSKSSIGGLVSCNLYGPSAHVYMTTRDHVLSIRTALPGGFTTRWGTGMIKDVAGYNVKRLIVGSYGTLGAIYEVIMRIHAVSEATAVIVTNRRDSSLRGLRPTGVITIGDNTYIRFDGSRSEVEYRVKRATEIAGGNVIYDNEGEALWSRITSMDDLFSCETIIKITVPPSRLRYLESIMEGYDRLAIMNMLGIMYIGFTGILDPRHILKLRSEARELGGSLVILRAPLGIKRMMDVWGLEDNMDIMVKLKGVFDPLDQMSAGRLLRGGVQ